MKKHTTPNEPEELPVNPEKPEIEQPVDPEKEIPTEIPEPQPNVPDVLPDTSKDDSVDPSQDDVFEK